MWQIASFLSANRDAKIRANINLFALFFIKYYCNSMADVTIQQLNTQTPLGSHVLPYSDYSSTKKAVISALPVDYTSIVNSPSRALLVYDVPSGTNGGVALNNQWRSRPINTIVYNKII